MAKKCLITGVAGFIGSTLAGRLLEMGYSVRGVDCFIDYYPRVLKENNLKKLTENPNFEFIEGNLLEISMRELLNGTEVVFHQAAQAGVRSSWGQQFSIYTQNNIHATQMLLEAAKASPIRKFIYASSSSVYGDSPSLPLREDSFLQPVSPYGVSKLAAEQLCYLYWKNFQVPVVSLRYFTVYGPGQRPDMAFNKFIRALIKDVPITLYGNGEQTRDFTFISDAVQANILAMESDCRGEVFNIGGGSRVTVSHCLGLLREISGVNPRINREAFSKGDMRHTMADTTKAKKLLGYSPEISLAEGLEREYNWLRDLKRSGLWE